MRTQRVIALAIGFLIFACLMSSIVVWKNKNLERPLPPTNGIIFSYHDGVFIILLFVVRWILYERITTKTY